MREPTKVARKLVTVGRDKVGVATRQATHWNIMSCVGKAQARAYARVIRRVVADGILESRTRA